MARSWKVAIAKDSSKPMLGLHALHVAFRGLPDVEVVAQFDANADGLERKLSFTQAKRLYGDYLEMLDKERPDIVVLCSRHPGDHLPQIKAAAGRGCAVYCEKPLSSDLREADEIVEIVEKSGMKLCVAHPARYSLPYLTMKAMIERGEIGTPFLASGRGKCDHRGGGEDMIVLGTHILDLQSFLFGAPTSVWADVKANGLPIVKGMREKTVEPIGPSAGDDLYACFKFPNGVRGVFESRRGLPGVPEGIVQMGLSVSGTKGTLSMRFNDAASPVRKLRICRKPGPLGDDLDFEEVPLIETRSIPGAAPLELSLCGQPDIPSAPFFLEANRFAVWDLMKAIEEDRQPVSNVYNARVALEMVCGVYASSLSGREIELPLAARKHPLEA